jgi:peptidoglycan/xylan/chitin deacetylase (PgdA/CDA1 family)
VRILGVVLALVVLCAAATAATVASVAKPGGAPRRPAEASGPSCPRGLVALTFDDGPSASVTPRLVRTLKRLHVPATFFMVGSRVAAAPEVARMVHRAGFTIGNHTWAHTDLTTQSDAEIAEALRSTQRALRKAGVRPSRLMRPPYGALDDAARSVIRRHDYVPVLWTVDTEDWTDSSPKEIRARALNGVRRKATNIVLHHDGVANSPATLRALPGEVAALRERGYCFVRLDDAGRPASPR